MATGRHRTTTAKKRIQGRVWLMARDKRVTPDAHLDFLLHSFVFFPVLRLSSCSMGLPQLTLAFWPGRCLMLLSLITGGVAGSGGGDLYTSRWDLGVDRSSRCHSGDCSHPRLSFSSSVAASVEGSGSSWTGSGSDQIKYSIPTFFSSVGRTFYISNKYWVLHVQNI